MTNLEKIEQDIASLSHDDLNKLAEWLAEFQAEQWDRQIEEDARAGRLDKFIEEAKVELAAGKTRPL